jgi:ureidoacrylate peracid hydrolase
MPQVPIRSDRAALVLFDMLNCFVHSPDPERARHNAETGIVDRCAEMLTVARRSGIVVFYVNSVHRPDGRDYASTVVDANTELVPWTDGPHLMDNPPGIEGTAGAKVIVELEPEPADFVVPKHRWSAFAGTSLDILLRGIGIDTIILAGGSTDIGILATAYAARDLAYNLIVLRDACQTHRRDAQDFCMHRLFPRMGRVMTVAEATTLIASDGGPVAPEVRLAEPLGS